MVIEYILIGTVMISLSVNVHQLSDISYARVIVAKIIWLATTIVALIIFILIAYFVLRIKALLIGSRYYFLTR